MRRGRANKKVLFQKRDASTDARGAPEPNWQDHVTRWAEVQPMNGDRFFAEFGPNTEVDTRIRLRWDPALADIVDNPDDYSAVVDGIRYEVRAPINDRLQDRELVLACRRGGTIYV